MRSWPVEAGRCRLVVARACPWAHRSICAAGRHPALISGRAVAAVLDTVTLVDVSRGDPLAAGALVPLRSHEALHLATALRLGVDEIVSYDAELARAAEAAGLRVVAPR